MEQVSTESPENILGRSPAEIEKMAIADGFIPKYRLGDKLEGNHAEGSGVVDAIVLFKIREGYTWGCRFEGAVDYYPQDHLKKIETTT